MNKKILFTLLSLLIICSSVFAQGEVETAVIDNETKVFVDSLGREVEVPVNIERVAPSGNLSQQIIYSITPYKMVGWSSKPTNEMNKYFYPEVLSRPVYGTFYGKKANLNMEALLVANPQVVVDIGEIKGSKEEMIKDLDDLQAKLNIPVVFIASYLDKMGDTYRDLGELLNEEEKASIRAEICDDTISLVTSVTQDLNNEEKISVYYGLQQDGLTSFPKGNFHTQVFPLLGIENLVDGVGNWIKVSPEQILIYNPDVILLAEEAAFNYFTSSSSPYKEVDAVKNNKVYLIPEGPFDWIDSPPAMNRILGLKWLGNLIYPQKYNLDVRVEAKEFYDIFYHYQVVDEELDVILKHATN